MRYSLQGARFVDAQTDLLAGEVVVDGATIASIGSSDGTLARAIDVTGMIVTPGFIDVHTHGGGGFNLHTAHPEEILDYARWVPTTGVTAFLVGVVGIPGALPEPQIHAAVTAIDQWDDGAQPLGIHLEGPYISEHKRGAHLPSWLRAPDAAETARILMLTGGHLRILTLAPELPAADEMIRRLVAAGVTVSMGHTDATYEQALTALQQGITHMTHCCNAMRPLHHRDPGPLSAIAFAPQAYGELIADGVHVHPAMMRVIVELLGTDRVIVITDALAAAGLDDASFEFAGQPAQVLCGVARLSDGTITGSVLTMDQALRNMITMTKVTLCEAVGMLTKNPAHAAQVSSRKGRLQAGYDADILIFDADLQLQATLCRGEIAYATASWRERLASAVSA